MDETKRIRGYTPNRFRLEISTPNDPLDRSKLPWKQRTLDEALVEIARLIDEARDPIFEVKLIAIDPLGPLSE